MQRLKRAWQALNTQFSLFDPVGLGYILSNNDPIPEDITSIDFKRVQIQTVSKNKKALSFVFALDRENKETTFVELPVSFLKEQYPKYRNGRLRDDILSEAITQGYEHLADLLKIAKSFDKYSMTTISPIFGSGAAMENFQFIQSDDVKKIPDARSMAVASGRGAVLGSWLRGI
jgi:hypothetical protein